MESTGTVHNIFHLNKEKKFSEDQAYELVNLFHAITSKSKVKINGHNSRLDFYKAQPELADNVQFELNTEIQKWSEKVRRLGGVPLSLYKVKIPASEGHFTWEFPSSDIEYSL